MIATSGDPHGYQVVVGEKGVGKTCMLNSAIYRLPGVVTVKVDAGATQHQIITKVLKKIGKRTTLSIVDPIPSAIRTIACYRFMFRRSPVVVIQASERQDANIPAELTGAVRDLIDTYNLRVVLDSSPNSLDAGILTTGRETVMELERMSKEQIFSIAQFSNLFKSPGTAALAGIAFQVLGGNPQKYVSLDAHIRGRETIARLLNEPADHADYISQFLTEKIFEAIKTIDIATTANPDMVKIIPKLENSGFEL